MFIDKITNSIALADTAKKTVASNSDPSWIMHHVLDANYVSFEPLGKLYLPQIHVFGLDISITRDIFIIWVVSAILIILSIMAARGYKKSIIPKGIANIFEIIIEFVRDEIVKPSIGKGYESYLPYMLTLFFFVLFCNIFGLIPAPNLVVPTGNIAVTAALALMSFIAIQYSGIKSYGFIGYFKGLVPPGMPGWILIIIVPLEILGLFTKPFALCIRLFANMIAGHIVIFSLLGLIFIMHTIYVSPVAVGFTLFIEILELLVALIQAYVFVMLTSLFIGMAKHMDH
jgi:F-type H+-transporting ATPase subunit a